ncbi:MAG: prephenate dehydrogenase [Dehalococcoidia bacterium]
MKVAIIGGSGKMGRWFTGFLLKEGDEVRITGRNQERLKEASRQLGVKTETNTDAVQWADVVLLSVPIDDFAGVVKQIAPYTSPDQTVIEITSVKMLPIEAMHSCLNSKRVLGVHPMFGPGATDIAHHNFVLTPTNDDERALALKVYNYLSERGAKVVIMSPDEHDRMMSVVLSLCHFVALAAADTLLGVGKLQQLNAIGGTSYRMLMTFIASVISEDPALYAALQMNLPFTVEMEELFQEKVKTWADVIKNRDRQQFMKHMEHIRNVFTEENTDVEGAYRDGYKLVENL